MPWAEMEVFRVWEVSELCHFFLRRCEAHMDEENVYFRIKWHSNAKINNKSYGRGCKSANRVHISLRWLLFQEVIAKTISLSFRFWRRRCYKRLGVELSAVGLTRCFLPWTTSELSARSPLYITVCIQGGLYVCGMWTILLAIELGSLLPWKSWFRFLHVCFPNKNRI